MNDNDATAKPFVDPKVEGTFITSDSREKVNKYIQEQIKAHEAIICYYKRRQNALTVTCQLPLEVLASIFSHVVRDNVEDYADTRSVRHYCTNTFSHICSHWREVALSTPILWSTINLRNNPAWTLEMLQHSKAVPLSVIHAGEVSLKAYPVLIQILKSHLPRIKNLLLDHIPELWPGHFDINDISIGIHDIGAILQLLGQQDSLKLERLAIKTPMILRYPYSHVLHLPDRIMTRSASLKHLALSGYGINWEVFPAFEGLKSFTISHIPGKVRPSMVQLLRFISRVPLLDTLLVANIDSSQGTLLSSIERVHMEYLENLDISCNSISIIHSFFDHLILPENGISTVTITVVRMSHEIEVSGLTALQELTRRLDDITNGPVLYLALGVITIGCWKHKRKRLNSEDVQTVLESLRLDQVVYLKVTPSNDVCDEEVWSLIGDLPQLKELQVYRCRTRIMVEALCRQVQPKTGTPSQATTHLAFPALAVLEIISCNFYDQDASDMEELFDCIELRREAKLPLKRLRIVNCHGIEHFHLNNLRQIIDQVIWDGSGAVENERGHEDVEDYMDFSDYD